MIPYGGVRTFATCIFRKLPANQSEHIYVNLLFVNKVTVEVHVSVLFRLNLTY
jgi:hypothetical protein